MIPGILGLVFTEQSQVAVITGVFVVIGALITAFGTVFVVIAERGRRAASIAAHEARPNSGSTQRDAVNRIESMVQTLVKDTGDLKRDVSGLREENLADRKSAADDRQAAENRDLALGNRITNLEKGSS